MTIDRERLAVVAGELPDAAEVPGLDPAMHFGEGPREDVIAFTICNDAINFGSGWWPTIRKDPGRSGYMTMAGRLADRFRAAGPWPAVELAEIKASEIAAVLDQDPEHELMALYAASLRDLGTHVRDDVGGSWERIVDEAEGSAVALASRLAGWDCFADVSPYEDFEVPLFKRAQLTAADLRLAVDAPFDDWTELTLFADNLVPHVLGVDGVLVLDPEPAARIEREELLLHDSPEEVELRACAVHAVELLADATDRRLCPAEIDLILWTRGQGPRYKAHPRPRARSTAY